MENTKTENVMTKEEKKSKRAGKAGVNRVSTILCLVFAVTGITLALYLISMCVVTDPGIRGGIEVIDAMDGNGTSFRDTEQFAIIFNRDINAVVDSLAVSDQMETNGKFDGDKKIDIIRYFYRRNPGRIPEKYKDIHIEYRLADLLAWSRSGVQYFEVDASEWNKRYPEYPAKDEYAVSNEESMLYSVIIEDRLPADGVSLYERDYPDGAALFGRDDMDGSDEYGVTLQWIIQSDLEDIKTNYDRYDKSIGLLGQSGNMKFVLFDPEGRMVRSNLRLDDSFMKLEREDRNEQLRKAFAAQKVNVSYVFGNASAVFGQGLKIKNVDMISSFRSYDYAIEDGSELIMCVLDENVSDELLGKYRPDDIYGRADAGYRNISQKAASYIIMIILAFATAFIAFIVFTVTIPALEKEKIRGFHRIPTIVAAVIMLCISGILAAPPLALFDEYVGLFTVTAGAADMMLVIAGICMTLEIAAFLYGWYSLVLRIKSRTFFSNSLFALLFVGKKSVCARVFAFVSGVVERVVSFFGANNNIFIRRILPYAGFLFINLIILAATDMNGAGIFLCLVFDTAVGVVLFLEEKSSRKVAEGVEKIVEGDTSYQIDIDGMFDGNKKMAQQVNKIGSAVEAAVQKSLKDERMKTELITNVSHDIKTPLTSIINYVDLLKRENIPGEKAGEYIRVLDEKSQRLKVLINDLVEASKISSGNLSLNNTAFDMRELLGQSLGEFEDRLSDRDLSVVYERPGEPVEVFADSARTWRILENLMGNVCKYSMPGSRVYIELAKEGALPRQGKKDAGGAGAGDGGRDRDRGNMRLTIKNISRDELNISVQELTERFVRGDESRNTEGSGLGLSIAKDLAHIMGGGLDIHLDGDLFKVTVTLPLAA